MNARRSDGSTPLHLSMLRADVRVLSLLLARGAQATPRDESASTPLHRGAWSGNAEAVRLLLQAGADVRARDAEGRTPLHRLWRPESGAVALLLLEAGADPNAVDGHGQTPLDAVRAQGREDLSALLCARGGRSAAPVPRVTPASPATATSGESPSPSACTLPARPGRVSRAPAQPACARSSAHHRRGVPLWCRHSRGGDPGPHGAQRRGPAVAGRQSAPG